MKILCKLGFHKKKVIGTAIYPFDVRKRIIGFGCTKCGKKLEAGLLIPASIPDDQIDEYIKKYA